MRNSAAWEELRLCRAGAPQGPSWTIPLPALLLQSLSHDDPVLLRPSILGFEQVTLLLAISSGPCISITLGRCRRCCCGVRPHQKLVNPEPAKLSSKAATWTLLTLEYSSLPPPFVSPGIVIVALADMWGTCSLAESLWGWPCPSLPVLCQPNWFSSESSFLTTLQQLRCIKG